MIELSLKRAPTVPLEAEVLSPDLLQTLEHQAICSLKVLHGKRQYRLDEFFDIRGEKSSQIHIQGDLSKVRWIGRAMSVGAVRIHGNVGMHLGAYMRGGQIEVDGDASDWVGAEMKNGLIRVRGNAGGQIGAGYRGSLSGMRNGLIHVTGTAGLEVGLRMRRGTIVIGDRVRDFAGLQMKGGTIVLLKGAEIRSGAWMNRGTILAFEKLSLMPTFRYGGIYDSTFLPILYNYLAAFDIALPSQHQPGVFHRYTGDHAVPGQGEIMIWQPQPA